MDAIELARQRAAELNAVAMSGGVDPWDSYGLCEFQAKRKGIEIERVARGSSVLNGARALYDPSMPLIIHEDTGSIFENAFLVAHELGHVELGDATERDEVREIDPARPAEMPPVGAERVEDYSRRQRREVQMDLFAREFLLPRSTARHLHLVEGLTATAITARLGAPLAAIAQQMLDALLLPEPVLAVGKTPVERRLNPNQKTAAEHSGAAYLLEAGPGTGKTQTLVGRVVWLLGKGVDPRSILVLTYSNKAAGELFDRIAQHDSNAAAAMWIGTFHAFGLDIVRRRHDRLGLPDDPRMLDKADAIELLELEAPRLGLVHFRNITDPTENLDRILAAISRAKDELVGVEEFHRLAADMEANATTDEERIEAEEQLEVAKVYRRYEDLKNETKRLDFGDLVTLPIKLFDEHDDVRAEVASMYEHILVDEYQDVNRSSVTLLRKLKPAGINLWAVGDIKQSIYRFRGASSVNMGRFATGDFPGATTGRLEVNYRSTKEIVDCFSAFAVGMNVARGRDTLLEAHRGASGHPAEHRLAEFATNEMEAVAEAILEMRDAGIPFREQAVLCTGNDRLAKLGSALEALGIPVLYLGSIFEREEVKDLLSFLSMLVDRRPMGLIRTATMDGFEMTLADAAYVIKESATNSKPFPIWTADAADLPELSDGGRSALSSLASALDSFGDTSYPWDVLVALLLDRTRIAAHLAESSGIASRAKGIAVWQLLNFCRTQPAGKGLPIRRLLDRIRRLVRLSDERDLRQLPIAAQGLDAVRLMTVHGSKGLEFGAVHFPGISADSIPRSPNHFAGIETPDGLVKGLGGKAEQIRSAGHRDEQECLFYVALSRAKDRMFLYSPQKKANGYKWSLSEFAGRIVPPATKTGVTTALRLPVPGPEAIDVSFAGTARFQDSQLNIYDKCPRQFLYSYVVETGGRRVESEFMRMHDAVQEVVDWIVGTEPHQVDDIEVERRLRAAMTSVDLVSSGYAEDYYGIGRELLAQLVASRHGHTRIPASPLTLAAGKVVVDVRVDEVLRSPGGDTIARRIRTGHGTKSSRSDLSATSFFMAVREAFPEAIVELSNLGDADPIRLDFDKLAGRREKVEQSVAAMEAGFFQPKPSSRTCHRCPAFFICGPIPAGPLVKKF